MKTIAVAAALAVACFPALADFPERAITIIVPFTAGGSSDIVARTVSPKMTQVLGQPIIVDNKPGANGALAAAYVAKAKNDGYTILIGSIGTYAINPVLYKDLAYEPRRDFDLLTVAVRTPNALVAHPGFPPNSVAELIDYLKKNPQQVSFASSGTGSSDHLTAVLFWQKTGTSGIHVPYKGGSAAHLDLISGTANVSFQNLGSITNHVRGGKMKLLAVTSEARDPTFPNVPTLAQAGVPGLEVYSWQAFVAPKGLPREASAKLQAALLAALRDPEIARKLTDIGFEVVANSPAEFSAFLTTELARWEQVVDAGGIRQSD